MTRDTDYTCCIRTVRLDKGKIRRGKMSVLFKYLQLEFPKVTLSEDTGQTYQRLELAKEVWVIMGAP